ncbi:MAG TPA: right-handed parallel beta-helix repeat-containing protein, partial [Gemmatimonadales bacterium]|nr:right-handed parallel beta-helix repeat-containing protein [Gemmatimonadales bacterium]
MSDRPTGAGAGQLELLLQDLNGTTLADHQRMMARLDRDEFARLFAYLFLVGDPYHMDGVHNQLIYEDPSTQQLHPIPWDVRLLRLSEPEKPLSYLFQAVLRDPFVVDATMRELGRRLADDGALRIADSLVRAAENRYAGYFAYDRLRQGLIPEVGDTATAMAILRANAAYLRRWLANDTIAVQVSAAPGGYLVDLEARGMVGADLEGFTVDRAVAGRVTLRLDSNRSGVPDAGDRLLALRSAGGGLQLDQPVPLYAAWDASQPSMRAGTQSYRLFVAGLPAGVKLVPELKNRATGLPAATVAWEAGSPVPAGSGWHAWDFPERVPRAERYSGTVRLHETVRIPAGDTLLIEPGTTLLLDPDVSVVSRGLVLAQGTAARPIRVLPSQPGVPWGTFSLLGHGADSSRFSYVEFAQGGGALVDRIEFTGMVNVHWANDVRFEHGFFHDNLRSDDTFHAMHSQVVVRESHFLRANSDAVDFDIAGGVVADNQFEQTGGDAIDLMTSTPRIFGNRISGSGDKGISVGEASRPFIFDNLIDSCDIGVEIKDRSEAVLLHNRLTNNRIGMRERRKNWRYGGGGWTTVAASVFAGNRTPLVRDPFSRLTLLDAVGLDSAGSAAVVAP